MAQEIQNTKGAGSAVASEISLQSSSEREVGGIGSIARVVADECLTALVVRWLAVYSPRWRGRWGWHCSEGPCEGEHRLRSSGLVFMYLPCVPRMQNVWMDLALRLVTPGIPLYLRLKSRSGDTYQPLDLDQPGSINKNKQNSEQLLSMTPIPSTKCSLCVLTHVIITTAP